MADAVDLGRLRETLGGPELAWIVERARRRLARGESVRGVVSLRAAGPAQRAALDRLLGRPPSKGVALTVHLDDLDRLLRHARLAPGLEAAVEALTGRVTDERSHRAATEQAWDDLFARAAATVGDRPPLVVWLERLRAGGLVRRLAGGDLGRARALLDQAAAVVVRLPASGTPLAELAAAATGDSHALDRGTAVGTLASRAAALLGGVEAEEGARGRRDAWAAVGVLCDELSAPVLTLNLAAVTRPVGATGRALAAHAEVGEPYRISTRQLLREPLVADGGRAATVHVCENPTVVAAAANRLGPGCTPLVCVEGQPRTAARLLLEGLTASGMRLAYHGDFDWGGVRIANRVIGHHGAVPWRLSATDYRAAPAGTTLRGRPVTSCWDPELASAMLRRGRAVHEEQLLTDLLADLAD